MATNCDVHTYNQKHYNGDEYFIISSHIFDFWITISANKKDFSENIFLSLDTLGLENKKYLNTNQKLLVNIMAQTPDHPVLREIPQVEVNTNSKTITIYQILQTN